MDTCRSTLLGKTHDRGLNVLRSLTSLRARTTGHCKIGILIYHDNKVWQILMSLCRKEIAILILLIIKLEVVHTCEGKKLITLIHLDTQRVQNEFRLLCILNDSMFTLILLACGHRHDGKIMLQKGVVCCKLDHLRVDEDELKL